MLEQALAALAEPTGEGEWDRTDRIVGMASRDSTRSAQH